MSRESWGSLWGEWEERAGGMEGPGGSGGPGENIRSRTHRFDVEDGGRACALAKGRHEVAAPDWDLERGVEERPRPPCCRLRGAAANKPWTSTDAGAGKIGISLTKRSTARALPIAIARASAVVRSCNVLPIPPP